MIAAVSAIVDARRTERLYLETTQFCLHEICNISLSLRRIMRGDRERMKRTIASRVGRTLDTTEKIVYLKKFHCPVIPNLLLMPLPIFRTSSDCTLICTNNRERKLLRTFGLKMYI